MSCRGHYRACVWLPDYQGLGFLSEAWLAAPWFKRILGLQPSCLHSSWQEEGRAQKGIPSSFEDHSGRFQRTSLWSEFSHKATWHKGLGNADFKLGSLCPPKNQRKEGDRSSSVTQSLFIVSVKMLWAASNRNHDSNRLAQQGPLVLITVGTK